MKTKNETMFDIIEANNKLTIEMAKRINELEQRVAFLTESLARAEGEIKNLNK